jgi:hypothetical protein
VTQAAPGPRTIVTPEAFQIDPALLGLPLASPWRRLSALLVDLALVGILTAALADAQVLLWAAIGVILVRVALKRAGRPVTQASTFLLRASVGCLGVLILTIVGTVAAFSVMSDAQREDVTVDLIEAGAELGVLDSTRIVPGRADSADGAAPVATAARLDTVAELEARVAELTTQLATERRTFASLMAEVWDQIGSAIGLWSLYFALLLPRMRGQTIGKRLLGVRVMRLDGQPITWWAGLERAGGYAAGLATGFLGFAQIFWDRNRQCIHDKIVGTVVVAAGAQPRMKP